MSLDALARMGAEINRLENNVEKLCKDVARLERERMRLTAEEERADRNARDIAALLDDVNTLRAENTRLKDEADAVMTQRDATWRRALHESHLTHVAVTLDLLAKENRRCPDCRTLMALFAPWEPASDKPPEGRSTPGAETDKRTAYELCPIYQKHDYGAPCRECNRLLAAFSRLRAENTRPEIKSISCARCHGRGYRGTIRCDDCDGFGWKILRKPEAE